MSMFRGQIGISGVQLLSDRCSLSVIMSSPCSSTRGMHSFVQESLSPSLDLSLVDQKQLINSSEYQQIQIYATLLQNARSFSTGSITHYMMFHAGYTGKRFLNNLLIEVYGKFGALRDALYIFYHFQRKNLFSWNIMFTALVQHGQALLACQLFNQMLAEGLLPDKFTYSNIVDACTIMDSLSEGTRTHCVVVENACESHVVVATALINMYNKHGELSLAKLVFDQVSKHDTVSYSAMIETYANHGYERMPVHLFQQMQRESVKPDPVALIAVLGACATFSTLAWGKIFHSSTIESGLESDLTVGNALVNMYAKCGSLDDGLSVFKHMQVCDVISWTAMISAYNQAGLAQEALQLFAEMQADGVMPNAITFLNILTACSHEGMLEEGILCFSVMCKDVSILPTSQHYSCLIDLLGRAGRLEEGELVIKNTEVCNSAVVWHALLGACKAHKDVDRGVQVAERIIHLEPLMCAAYMALSDFYVA